MALSTSPASRAVTLQSDADLSELELHPDNRRAIAREFAKKLALRQAHEFTLGHYATHNSEHGNLVVPVLRTRLMAQ